MEPITLELAQVMDGSSGGYSSSGRKPMGSMAQTRTPTSRGTGVVKQYQRRTKKGKVVTVKQHKAGKRRKTGRVTQTAQHIRKNGLKWGGKTFRNAHVFGSWLRARGSSLHHFRAKHGPAVAHAIPHFHKAAAHERKKYPNRVKKARAVGRAVSG